MLYKMSVKQNIFSNRSLSYVERKTFRGFTLVEVLVGSAVFLAISVAFYGAYVNIFRLAEANQAKILAVQIASAEFESVRNMPYVDVGIKNNIPNGVLDHIVEYERGGIDFEVSRTIRNVDLSDSGFQASSKLVEIIVNCKSCRGFSPVSFTSLVAPADLQSASYGGAILVRVMDSSGNPVPSATIELSHVASSSISNTDISNNRGFLSIVGVPPAENAYRIEVSKDGYSRDSTAATSSANPSPSNPDLTVLDNQVTESSFVIDRLSSLSFSSVDRSCDPVGEVDFDLIGSKSLGDGVLKYEESLATDASGNLNLPQMEWDTYKIISKDILYHIAGITPLSPFVLYPDNHKDVQIVAIPKSGRGLLVVVRDSANGLPLSDAAVRVYGPGGYDRTLSTGRGYWEQTDWSNGSGQDEFVDRAAYKEDDGHIDVTSSPGSISLKDGFGQYSLFGTLESSIFDTGDENNFYEISWSPQSQPLGIGSNGVRIQLASNREITPTSTWSFIGPDGTSGTYYSVPGTPISTDHNGDRYLKYKIFLSTESATVTPMISDVSVAYTSGCTPPGQAFFTGLDDMSYNIEVMKPGYDTVYEVVDMESDWQVASIDISQ